MTAEGPAQSRAPVAAETLSQKRAAPPVPPNLQGFLSLQDFEAAAAQHLPRMLHGCLAGRAETDWSLIASTSPRMVAASCRSIGSSTAFCTPSTAATPNSAPTRTPSPEVTPPA